MRFRKLRIAWSVFWGLLAVLLIVACLAIQYQGATLTLMRRGGPGPTDIRTYKGRLFLSWEPRVSYRPEWAGQTNRYGFRYNMYSDASWNVSAPAWQISLLLATAIVPLAALPWLPYHFSLRTLLIATTLVGMVLGLIVWLR
jgi:hypothetical protein